MAVGGLSAKQARIEWAARWLVAGLALGLPLAGIGAWAWNVQAPALTVHARMAEAGGWGPGDLAAVAGEPLHLRLTSDDVLHGFAVGQRDAPALDLPPGEVVETTLTFDEPGTYVYYCTRWCGLGHWRMRGTITVTGMAGSAVATVEPPLYVRLGLDLDAPHPAAEVPSTLPAAVEGAAWADQVPYSFLTRPVYEATSPAALWQALKDEPATNGLTPAQRWDLVAWVWRANTDAATLAEARALYTANCAACHGEQGAGDGVFAATLEQTGPSMTGHGTQRPADFTDAGPMLGASGALLHGKIIRGGMGTGMPYWGPIFTERQTWALVDYLWSFQFQYEEVTP